MNSATAALLALLLVCSLPAMTLVAADSSGLAEFESSGSVQDQSPQQTPVEVDGTTNRLPIGDAGTSYTHVGTDLGTVLASSDDELRIDHEQYVIAEREFDTASPDEQAAMIEDAHDRIEERALELEEREEEIIRGHANGERSDGEAVRMLLRNYNEAVALQNALDDLNQHADMVPGYSLSNQQRDATEATLGFHRTPIRTNLALASERVDPNTEYDIRLQTSQHGYRVSILDGSTYVSETTRFDNREPHSSDQFAEIEDQTNPAFERGQELYPWASDSGSPSYPLGSGPHLVRLVLDDHHLEIYLDGGSGEVHRELQELSVSSLPVDSSQSWTNDGLEMTLNETPANGPAEVVVTDESTGDPVPATISIDDHEVGQTGVDGSRWILPPDDNYELIAETDSGTVEATVDGNWQY
ncbi:DUF7096 domain-containing protein [Natrialba swarupiae]|uniref:Uncharacterized protein n=1 Tax=Natrialba swarupiae TaxID=2448032 RepID=A0A5D5AS47_9EURY|nr:hypothetical protein [Natrialba swarupiae]TYT62320.1 hypothetical protein FYC77_08860 [Natrialba swarupiae]